jgi:hypothetical protein
MSIDGEENHSKAPLGTQKSISAPSSAPQETEDLRLLRQYFPKKTDLSVYSQADLNKVALRLNQRPRKTLGFETPASKLQASVASTG